jgi:hypothetical protein
MATFDLTSLTVGELLQIEAGLRSELIRRGVSRTGNNPCGDFAEYLAFNVFGWKLNANSEAGFDATDANGQRIEIKARRLSHPTASRQASAIRNINEQHFDRLFGIVFSQTYEVLLAVDVPHAVVVSRARHNPHTNSAIFFLRDDLREVAGVVDRSSELKKGAQSLLAERG